MPSIVLGAIALSKHKSILHPEEYERAKTLNLIGLILGSIATGAIVLAFLGWIISYTINAIIYLSTVG